jgi:hypothetical protein
MQTGRWRNGIRPRLDEMIEELFERFPPTPGEAADDGGA